MTKTFDVLVIGSGPGGYVAAIRASQLGLKAAVVEADQLGGICLNWGCIPTKALLRSAEIGRNIRDADKYGWKVSDFEPDITKIATYSRDVSGKLSSGVKFLLKKNKVDVIKGWGKLLGKGVVCVENNGKTEQFSAKNIILATGARSRVLPGMEPDGNLVLTSKEAMQPTSIPKSILVIGSGAIGVEFASFYNDIGTKVTLVEVQKRILPAEDEEVSAFAQKAYEKHGMTIWTDTKVQKLTKQEKLVTASFLRPDGSTEEDNFDKVISAVGIVGNVENIGLENTSVKLDGSHIQTNEWMETNERGVFAIGDVTGAPWLAHKASHEAISCVEKIARFAGAHATDKTRVPGCTYSHPQIASMGLTEAKAKEQKLDVKIGRFPFAGNGKAIALGEPEGFVKLIFEKQTGAIVGAHLVGTEVTELIHSIAVAINLEATEEYLMQTIFPHPTLSEMLHEATLAADGRAIHI